MIQFQSKIKIPRGFAMQVAPFRDLQRTTAVYFTLKAVCSSGRIENYRQIIHELADACFISKRIFETRLKELFEKGFATIDKKALVLKSFKEFNDEYGLKNGVYHYLDPEKLKAPLKKYLQALFIKETQRKCQQAHKIKLDKIPELKNELKQILGVSDRSPIFRQDILVGLLHRFKTGQSELQNIYALNFLNPYTQVSCAHLQERFGYSEKSTSGPSYMKKKLKELGLITYRSVQIETEATKTKNWMREIVCGRTYWSRIKKRLILQLPDEILCTF